MPKKKGTDIECYISKGHTDCVNCLQIIEGSLYTASKDGSLRIWSLSDGSLETVMVGHTGEITVMKYSDVQMVTASGNVIKQKLYTGSADKTARIWDISTGQSMRVFKGHTMQISCLDVGQKEGIEGNLFTASWDKCVRKWDSLTGEMMMVIRGHTQRIYCIQVVTDTVYTAGRDGTTRIWDGQTGDSLHILRGHDTQNTRGSGGVYCMQVLRGGLDASAETRAGTNLLDDENAGDDVLLTAGADGTVRLWNATTAEPGMVIEIAPGCWINNMKVVGAILYTATFDKAVRSWHLHTGDELQLFKGHSGVVWCMHIEEPYLYTGSEDSSVRVWDTNTGEQVHLLQGHEPFTSVLSIEHHDGIIYSGSSDFTVRHWLLEAS